MPQIRIGVAQAADECIYIMEPASRNEKRRCCSEDQIRHGDAPARIDLQLDGLPGTAGGAGSVLLVEL